MAAEIYKIDDKTWRVENGFVRFFVLAGDRVAVLLDSGADCPEAKTLAGNLTGLPVKLLNTHADGDHTSGNGAFSEVYICREDYDAYGMETKYPGCQCAPLTDGMVLDLGNRPPEILHIPGHTPGSVAVLDKNARVLYSGDSVQDGKIFLFGRTRRPAQLAASLAKLAARKAEFDSVYPCHGTPVLANDSPEKVLADWQKVLSGTLTGTPANLFGAEILDCQGDFCGFYTER